MADGISIERYCEIVLADWQTDVTPACRAAGEALWQVTCVHAGQKGTVLIPTPSQTDARAVIDYLVAMTTDQPHLSRLTRKLAGPDTMMLAGMRVMVLPRGTSRRPRGILAKVEMTDGVIATVDELPSDKEIARTVAHCLSISAHTGQEMDIALDIVRALVPDVADPEAWLRQNFRSGRSVESVQRQKERRSDAGFYYKLDVPQPRTSVPDNIHTSSKADWLASREFEEMRMRQIEERDWCERGQYLNQRVITKPRR